MRLLAGRESHPAVWDSVNWELSTTYFTLATLLQDYAPLSRKAQEQVRVYTSFTLFDSATGIDALRSACAYRSSVR